MSPSYLAEGEGLNQPQGFLPWPPGGREREREREKRREERERENSQDDKMMKDEKRKVILKLGTDNIL
jgi:hypothetical protein